MEIEPINIKTLNCFCCNFFVAKHKCILQLSEDIFLTVCLCDSCVKLDETELLMYFAGNQNKTVKQAARFLFVNEARVRQFIYSSRLKAEKIGRDLLIKTNDLLAFAEIELKTGRPMATKSCEFCGEITCKDAECEDDY